MPSSSTKRRAGTGDLSRIDPGAVGKRDEETLVRKHMLEHAGEEAGLVRGRADSRCVDTAKLKEARKVLRLLSDKAKRLNGKHFGSFPCRGRGRFHARSFAFP
jgi:hypothetical protein